MKYYKKKYKAFCVHLPLRYMSRLYATGKSISLFPYYYVTVPLSLSLQTLRIVIYRPQVHALRRSNNNRSNGSQLEISELGIGNKQRNDLMALDRSSIM